MPLELVDMLPSLIDDLEQSGVGLLRRLFRSKWELARPAGPLCAGSENPTKLEALFDDGPLLDKRNAVLDPVDHHFLTDGQWFLAQRSGGNV